jgi:hypothetical protein
VTFRAPIGIEGVTKKTSTGVGVVVDKKRGYVLVDRATCPIMFGVVEATIAGAIKVPCRILFVHPYQNFAIIQYDPDALGPGRLNELISELVLSEKTVTIVRARSPACSPLLCCLVQYTCFRSG